MLPENLVTVNNVQQFAWLTELFRFLSILASGGIGYWIAFAMAKRREKEDQRLHEEKLASEKLRHDEKLSLERSSHKEKLDAEKATHRERLSAEANRQTIAAEIAQHQNRIDQLSDVIGASFEYFALAAITNASHSDMMSHQQSNSKDADEARQEFFRLRNSLIQRGAALIALGERYGMVPDSLSPKMHFGDKLSQWEISTRGLALKGQLTGAGARGTDLISDIRRLVKWEVDRRDSRINVLKPLPADDWSEMRVITA